MYVLHIGHCIQWTPGISGRPARFAKSIPLPCAKSPSQLAIPARFGGPPVVGYPSNFLDRQFARFAKNLTESYLTVAVSEQWEK